MISVIIPVYNCEKYIEQAMESVILQTYVDVELIVVNDGSTDKTLEIINRVWNRHKPKGKIINIENGGLANARNVGIEAASGKYICNLDSDDFLEPCIFEQIITKYPNLDFDICFYGYNEISENGKYIKTYEDSFSYVDNMNGENALKAKLNRTIWICQGNALYRKQLIFEKNIYNIKGINQGEDFYFICLMLAYSNSVKCVQCPGVNIRVLNSSMMHQEYNESFKQSIIAAKNLFSRLTEDNKYKNKIDILSLVKVHIMEQRSHVAKKMILCKKFKIRELLFRIAKLTSQDFDELKKLKKYISLKKYMEFFLISKFPLIYIGVSRTYKMIFK